MSRITVEDCLEQVPNRFSLVLLAAQRTKQLLKGASPLIEDERDNKEVVLALREIAAGKVNLDIHPVIAEEEPLPPEPGGAPMPGETAAPKMGAALAAQPMQGETAAPKMGAAPAAQPMQGETAVRQDLS